MANSVSEASITLADVETQVENRRTQHLTRQRSLKSQMLGVAKRSCVAVSALVARSVHEEALLCEPQTPTAVTVHCLAVTQPVSSSTHACVSEFKDG